MHNTLICGLGQEKEIACGGYTQQLRWVDEKSSPKSKQTTVTVLLQTYSSPSCIKSININPYGFYLTDPQDRNLLEYHLHILPQLIYLNKSRFASIQAMEFLNTVESNNLVYPTALASAASHLFNQGCITKFEFFKKRQQALRAVRAAVGTPKDEQAMSQVKARRLPTRCHDYTISASLRLAGVELIQGSDLQAIYPFIYGTAALVRERYAFAEEKGGINQQEADLNSSLFVLTKRMLAYFDIMSSVPCARRPFLEEKYWLVDIGHIEEQKNNDSGLDPVMGCFATIIGLTGESAALVSQYFEQLISAPAFHNSQKDILHRLASWVPLRPNNQAGVEAGQEYDMCVSAGKAHSLATQIFLLRSADFNQNSPQLRILFHALHAAITGVVISSAPMTTMLWPLWVLACECYDSQSRDEIALPILDQLFQRLAFRNVSTCIKVIQERIWTLSSSDVVVSRLNEASALDETMESTLRIPLPGGWRQSEWVRYCWVNKIELILA